jgi:hypothetical protein
MTEPTWSGVRRVYLAGPMRGYPDFNLPAFLEGARLLRLAGYEVFSPAEHNLSRGLDTTMAGQQAEVERKFPLRESLAIDLDWICRNADGVVVLPGWEASAGACAEVAAAKAIGAPTRELVLAVVTRDLDG